MIITTHAVMGATVYSLLPENPALAAAAALASHYVLDFFPHWEYETNPSKTKDKIPVIVFKIAIDSAIAIALVSFMAAVVLPSSPKNFVMVWTGAIWGLLPDLLQLPYMFKFRKAPISWTQKIHDFFHSEDESLKKDIKKIVSQVVIVLACMTIVYMI